MVWLLPSSVNDLSWSVVEMAYHVMGSGNPCHGVMLLHQSDFLNLLFDNFQRKAFLEWQFYVSSDKMKGISENSFDRQHHRELVFMFMIVILSSWENIFPSLNRIPFQSLWNKLHSREGNSWEYIIIMVIINWMMSRRCWGAPGIIDLSCRPHK